MEKHRVSAAPRDTGTGPLGPGVGARLIVAHTARLHGRNVFFRIEETMHALAHGTTRARPAAGFAAGLLAKTPFRYVGLFLYTYRTAVPENRSIIRECAPLARRPRRARTVSGLQTSPRAAWDNLGARRVNASRHYHGASARAVAHRRQRPGIWCRVAAPAAPSGAPRRRPRLRSEPGTAGAPGLARPCRPVVVSTFITLRADGSGRGRCKPPSWLS